MNDGDVPMTLVSVRCPTGEEFVFEDDLTSETKTYKDGQLTSLLTEDPCPHKRPTLPCFPVTRPL